VGRLVRRPAHGVPTTTRRAALGLVLVAGLVVGTGAPPASASVDVSVNGVAELSMTTAQMDADADLRQSNAGTQQDFVSAKRLAELAGVSPENLDVDDAMTIGGGGLGYVYTQANILDTDGFLFATSFPPDEQIFYSDLNDGSPTGGGITQWPGVMPVDFTVSDSVLGVPAPTVYPADPEVGHVAEFSDSGSVTLNRFASDSPVDTNGLMYSWDFGDGSPVTAPSPSPVAPHTYEAAGSYQALVTVTDAAGNAGVSPLLTVPVGASTGPGPGNGAGSGNGASAGTSPGSSSTGGGTAPSKDVPLPSGPAKGSLAAHTPTVSPKPGSSSSNRGSGGNKGNAGGQGGGSGGKSSTGSGSGGKSSTGSGSGSANGHGRASGTATATGTLDSGAGQRQHPAKIKASLGALAAPNMTGVLLQSSGAPSSSDASATALGALSLLQSVARVSNGQGDNAGLPAWILGILAVLLLLISGIVREAGTKILHLTRPHPRHHTQTTTP
jgi:hypothetical protein